MQAQSACKSNMAPPKPFHNNKNNNNNKNSSSNKIKIIIVMIIILTRIITTLNSWRWLSPWMQTSPSAMPVFRFRRSQAMAPQHALGLGSRG